MPSPIVFSLAGGTILLRPAERDRSLDSGVMRRGRFSAAVAATAVAGLALVTTGAAQAASLYTGPSRRPGPDVLYRNTAAGRTTFTVRRKLGRSLRLVGSFARTDRIGANRVRFTGRLRGRRLAPGLYRVYARSQADGGVSGTITRYFTVLR